MASKRPLPAYQISNVRLLDDLPNEVDNQTANPSQIHLPAKQPRRYFDPQKMDQLVKSIQEHGVLEPLLVRPLKDGQYELIAGERRLRASQILKLDSVPIISKDVTDKQAAQIALVENLQREDLNPIEETEAILDLLTLSLDINVSDIVSILNQSANSKRRGSELTDNVIRQLDQIESLLANVGRFNAESLRTNRLPLLSMPEDILDILRQGKLEFTKARAIAKIKDELARQEILDRAIAEELSLVQIRNLIADLPQEVSTKKNSHPLKNRVDITLRSLKTSNLWNDPKKQKRLEKLMDQIETMLAEE